MHKKCYNGQYEEAEKEKSFFRLLPYSCLLLKWQLHHPKDTVKIAQIASHKHGLFCWTRCEDRTIAHPKGHELCLDECELLDTWMKERLTEQMIRILESRRESIGQQTFL
jgi:hypothetical protein